MKKIFIALMVLSFSCKNGGVKESVPVMKDNKSVDNVQQKDVAVIEKIPVPVDCVKIQKTIENPEQPVRRLERTKAPVAQEAEAIQEVAERRAEKNIKDSIANEQPGGGSDIEGYIPFIKQYYYK